MPRIVPLAWMPACRMERIITHWTAGGYKANSTDRKHYHLLIESDGKLIRGDFPITANEIIRRGKYAAHTLNANGGAIGISCCCMRGSRERPFVPGPSPMTRTQWDAMAKAAADLSERYGIPVTRTTILGHGEVQGNLGIRQRNKWDPLVLPWEPGLSRAEAGEAFRERVRAYLRGEVEEEMNPDKKLVIDGVVSKYKAAFDDTQDTHYLPIAAIRPLLKDGVTFESEEKVLRIRTK